MMYNEYHKKKRRHLADVHKHRIPLSRWHAKPDCTCGGRRRGRYGGGRAGNGRMDARHPERTDVGMAAGPALRLRRSVARLCARMAPPARRRAAAVVLGGRISPEARPNTACRGARTDKTPHPGFRPPEPRLRDTPERPHNRSADVSAPQIPRHRFGRRSRDCETPRSEAGNRSAPQISTARIRPPEARLRDTLERPHNRTLRTEKRPGADRAEDSGHETRDTVHRL